MTENCLRNMLEFLHNDMEKNKIRKTESVHALYPEILFAIPAAINANGI